jgi:hypothetical protein
MSHSFNINKLSRIFAIVLSIWALVLFTMFIKAMSFWNILANTYSYSENFTGKCWKNQNVGATLVKQDRSIHGLGNSITICRNLNGIYIVNPLPFGMGGSSIFVPWNEVTSKYEVEDKVLIADIYFSKTPGIWLQIDKRLWDKVVNYKNS